VRHAALAISPAPWERILLRDRNHSGTAFVAGFARHGLDS
jgi:hypothetical protein